MKVLSVVGARPNFMKVAPIVQTLRQEGHDAILVHTGQHYDAKMSEVFFDQLKMPRPDVSLNVGSGSHAVQTARIMERFEPVVLQHEPDVVLVAGDVNSTVACALVAVKLGVRVAHLEAGLRSGDRSMPEEINRLVTDAISDLLLTPSADGNENLHAEGVPEEKIAFVGNAMIDTLLAHREAAPTARVLEENGLKAGEYGLVTLHRPSNVDNKQVVAEILLAFGEIAADTPLFFPVHPRTKKQLEGFGLSLPAGVIATEPLGYLEFLALMANAKMVLTDSGGIQEETTALGVPCLTIRENTERPITITEGTNTLVGTSGEKILKEAKNVISGQGKVGRIPEKWDGQTAPRVVAAIELMNAVPTKQK
ncbi:MAG: UDP-N-acetylglucosamine 2-epimerase (non-hydrolyzing) [Deltaproteobacteria bacterium]|nr:UDP-N-acetylglucosamine 2-epimerase (non-hydrolyzing) [Deltaproteobacteria bacterium]